MIVAIYRALHTRATQVASDSNNENTYIKFIQQTPIPRLCNTIRVIDACISNTPQSSQLEYYTYRMKNNIQIGVINNSIRINRIDCARKYLEYRLQMISNERHDLLNQQRGWVTFSSRNRYRARLERIRFICYENLL